MIFHANKNIILSFFLFSYKAEAPPSPFLKKYYGKIIFLPTSYVGKDFFATGNHDINFFFILEFIDSSFLFNMNKFLFVQSSCFYNNFFLS